MSGRGRKKILQSLRSYVSLERFDCDGVGNERVIETSFYALEAELKKLQELGAQEEDPHGYQVRAAADRLALVIYDLQTRSVTPTTYIRDKLRLWRDTWIMPLLRELELKEEPKKTRGQ